MKLLMISVLLAWFFLSACHFHRAVSQQVFNVTVTARYEILLLPTITPAAIPPLPIVVPKLSPP